MKRKLGTNGSESKGSLLIQIGVSSMEWYSEDQPTLARAHERIHEIRAHTYDALGPFECDMALEDDWKMRTLIEDACRVTARYHVDMFTEALKELGYFEREHAQRRTSWAKVTREPPKPDC